MRYPAIIAHYWLRARVHRPQIGRFMSRDPVRQANLYTWPGNSPVVLVDPSGMELWPQYVRIRCQDWATSNLCCWAKKPASLVGTATSERARCTCGNADDPCRVDFYSGKGCTGKLLATAKGVECVQANPPRFYCTGCETAEPSDKCGPDVTSVLRRTVFDIELTFERWDFDEKQKKCTIGTGFLALGGWDTDLAGAVASPYVIPGRPEKCATGACSGTLGVDGKCYHHWAVNYVAFGVMSRLCAQFLLPPNWLDALTMKAFLWAWNTWNSITAEYEYGDWKEKYAWALAGFKGWPFSSSPPAGVSSSTCPACPLPYTYPGDPNPTSFGWHWDGYIDPGRP